MEEETAGVERRSRDCRVPSREAVPAEFESKMQSPPPNERVCITCLDLAVAAHIVELLPRGIARVDTGSTIEEVNVELVEAAVGDTVLVHAKVAIGKLKQQT
jgi:hydrogenase expression/formation protein HypC